MTIYLPKIILPLAPTSEYPLLFLGGPIRGGGDWQADMIDVIYRRHFSALIACPCRWKDTHRLSSRFHHPFLQGPNRQLVWERHYLKQAGLQPYVNGCVIFWLGLESTTTPHEGPEPYAMDTRREIGKFTAYAELMKVRMVVGGSRDFYGLDVILYELSEAFQKPFPFFETMDGLIDEALTIAREQ